jgi:hypothetical protein
MEPSKFNSLNQCGEITSEIVQATSSDILDVWCLSLVWHTEVPFWLDTINKPDAKRPFFQGIIGFYK